MKIEMANESSEVKRKATRERGSEIGKSRPKQKMVAHTISPVLLPVVDF